MFCYAKKILSVIGIGVLAGCAASGPTINAPIRQGAAVPAPAYRNGDQWAYQVSRSDGNDEQIRISYRNGKFEHDNPTVFDSTIFATVHHTNGDLKPLVFPLASGKSWSYRYQGTSRRGQTMWRDAEVKVIGPTVQPIATKAGRFKAVEIQEENLGPGLDILTKANRLESATRLPGQGFSLYLVRESKSATLRPDTTGPGGKIGGKPEN